jgi:hypothetical protein
MGTSMPVATVSTGSTSMTPATSTAPSSGSLRPNVKRALDWIDNYGDSDREMDSSNLS